MGWKGTIRSLNAMARRERRVRERIDRAAERIDSKIDRDATKAMERLTKTQAAIMRDPIEAFQLSYSVETSQFQSQPLSLKDGMFSSVISLPKPVGVVAIAPASYTDSGAFIRPIDMLAGDVLLVVALQVGHSDPNHRMRMNWIKKSDRASSHIFLLDAAANEYYFPVATSLTGEVVPGQPRAGLIAFEVLRRDSSALELHVRDFQLLGEKEASDPANSP